MTETNRIEYKRELTSELDIEKEVVVIYTFYKHLLMMFFKFINNILVLMMALGWHYDKTKSAPSKQPVDA